MTDLQAQRDRILNEIRRLAAENGGKAPGKTVFAEKAGIGEHKWNVHWARWSEALSEAGFAPNRMQAAYSDEELLTALAEETRRLGRVPTAAALRGARANRPGFPARNTFDRFGGTTARNERLLQWCTARAGLEDVLGIVSRASVARSTRAARGSATAPPSVMSTAALVSDSFLPPVVACLESLAANDAEVVASIRARGLDADKEFERRAGIAFRLLGLEYEDLGQGRGRNPDGIARCRAGGWAVLCDAKIRRDGYRLGTEDRKFGEYIDEHAPRLVRDGCSKIYFAVVSSRFDDDDLERARRLVRAGAAKSVVFFMARALATLVERRLRSQLDCDHRWLEQFFAETRIVEPESV